mgnify:CR=1 FL=1
MGDIIKTAQCRFCGQMVQIETDKELTQPQAEEQATMTCNCTEAVEYQKEKQRKEKAMMNVSALFGEPETASSFALIRARRPSRRTGAPQLSRKEPR